MAALKKIYNFFIQYFKRFYHFLFEKIKKNPRKAAFGGIFLVYFMFCLPSPLFDNPTSVVLEDNKGQLLGARIATDGQWRFPYQQKVPEKYAKALIAFEDSRFYYHFGVDPFSIGRAFFKNISRQKITSGGSTITMQVIRMARKNPPRNIFEKFLEAVMATRLECSHRKKTILALYASHAPFGGNVVGLEAASWRYFGKSPQLLSWAEASMLAVLPNAPSLIHLGKSREKLLIKRNMLLQKLYEKGEIDKSTYELSLEEPLPQSPQDLPSVAPHLLEKANDELFKKDKNALTRLQTTIDASLQQNLIQIMNMHHNTLKFNGINNMAAVIVDVETNNILAYVGNITGAGAEHQEYVDCAKASRSSGSVFKPLLFAMANQDGVITPKTLISDIPMTFDGYRPQNYFETYDGVIPSQRALVRSLNVPFVRILQAYGFEKFHYNLRKIGLTTLTKEANHYGLPIVLGGAETNLLDITNAYAAMARTVNHFSISDSKYFPDDFRPLNYDFSKKYSRPSKIRWSRDAPMLNAGACWLALEAMQNIERPTSAGKWEVFQSSKKIAWKTGTSFGFRDAWSIGTNPKYAVGVWVGNADGEGRPELVGIQVAAPVMLDIFNMLPSNDWFSAPYDELAPTEICKNSGYKPSEYCEKDTVWACKNSNKQLRICPYHQLLHLDATGQFQVTDACESPSVMLHKPWFLLPPVEEFYYKARNPQYVTAPPYRVDCQGVVEGKNPMQLIYPRNMTQIFVPKDLNGALGKTIFQAAHRVSNAVVHWHLDNTFLSSTKDFHSVEIAPSVGKHTIVLIDDKGNRIEQQFEILGK